MTRFGMTRFGMTRFGILLLLMATLVGRASAAGRVECGSVPSRNVPPSAAYCALLPDSYDAEKTRHFPALYFLHGLGGDSQFLVNTGGWDLIEELHARKLLGDFVVITPSAGRSFYVNSKNGHVKYEDFFIQEFIPAMEKKFRIGTTREMRAVSGVSMGGYGALRFAFKYPELFGSVSAHSPALVEKLPHGMSATNIGYYMGSAFGNPPDGNYWQQESPFALARTHDLHGLKIYFDCGSEDDFGFEVGARALDKLLTARGIKHEFHIYPGGHGWAYTARHLPASLEFHSKVWGK